MPRPLRRRDSVSSTNSDGEPDYNGRYASPSPIRSRSRGRRATSLNNAHPSSRRSSPDRRGSYHRPSEGYHSPDDNSEDDRRYRARSRDSRAGSHARDRSAAAPTGSGSRTGAKHRPALRSRSSDDHYYRRRGFDQYDSDSGDNNDDFDDYDGSKRRHAGDGRRRRAASHSPAPARAPPSSYHHHDHPHSSSDRHDDGDHHQKKKKDYYPPSASRSRSTYDHDRERSSSKRPKSSSRSQGRDRAEDGPSPRPRRRNSDLLLSAGRCALEAGTMAALKMRYDPSPWLGPKGAKVMAAALSAAAVDTFVEEKHPKAKGGMRHNMMRQATQLMIGNLVAKPIVNEAGKNKDKVKSKIKTRRTR